MTPLSGGETGTCAGGVGLVRAGNIKYEESLDLNYRVLLCNWAFHQDCSPNHRTHPRPLRRRGVFVQEMILKLPSPCCRDQVWPAGEVFFARIVGEFGHSLPLSGGETGTCAGGVGYVRFRNLKYGWSYG